MVMMVGMGVLDVWWYVGMGLSNASWYMVDMSLPVTAKVTILCL
jgi:hypothetical protein